MKTTYGSSLVECLEMSNNILVCRKITVFAVYD